MFCRKRDFLHVGGFDETLPIMEDADLCIRMHEAGAAPPAPSLPAPIQSHMASKDPLSISEGHGAGCIASSVLTSRSPGAAEQSRHLRQMERLKSKCKGRIRLVWWPMSETSGRRLAAWGNVKATWIHFQLGLRWYLGASPEQMHQLYLAMYTDAFR